MASGDLAPSVTGPSGASWESTAAGAATPRDDAIAFDFKYSHQLRDVAFAVGYESASQFSREYLRQFGAPPVRDVRQIRQAIGSPPMG